MAKKITLSPRGEIMKQDLQKVGKGALIAGGGAFATYLLQGLTQVDYGDWTPLVVALLSVVINFARKYITETKY